MSFRRILSGVTLGAVVSTLSVFGGGCLTRPVALGNPVTSTNFTTPYNPNAISKIDILFDIDNSASMGDKQQYLEAAVPDLIARLVTPNCVDAMGNPLYASSGAAVASNSDGTCPPDANGVVGSPEFTAIKDMHIGVVDSSLGPRGVNGAPNPNGGSPATLSATCPDSAAEDLADNPPIPSLYEEYLGGTGANPSGATIPKHNDDHAYLLNRTATPGNENAPTATSTAVTSSNFLAWYPASNTDPEGNNTVTDAADLQTDFEDLVIGAQDFGCGIESQLESWYRFLIQPDPYNSIDASSGSAKWVDVDTTIIQQRHDFLRPDSLVVIVDLTDENDSEIDVRALGGQGYHWLDGAWAPLRETSACDNASTLTSSACTSCGFASSNASVAADPNCTMDLGSGAGRYEEMTEADQTNWAVYNNTRHMHMKQKYGTEVQFPIERYQYGLQSAKIPDRDGEYPSGAQSYQGLTNLNCVNPLYAASLPQASDLSGVNGNDAPWNSTNAAVLCNLTPNAVRQAPGTSGSTSTTPLVYYAHIGGVPHELLTTTDANGNVTPKENLTTADWTAILGQDPETYNYTGIDPHMIESYQPRGNGINVVSATSTVNGDEADDWNTDGTDANGNPVHYNLLVDREYACVFALEDSMGNPTPRDCDPTSTTVPPTTISSCDCSSTLCTSTVTTACVTQAQLSPVCNRSNPQEQDYAKAYPTIRELLLAEKLGTQGIVSSLCPIVLNNVNDPNYGYRPAITVIIDRLVNALQPACLPQQLTPVDDAGDEPCLVLATLVSGNNPTSSPDESQCVGNAMYPSLQAVDPTVLAHFRADQAAAFNNGTASIDLSQYPTCEVKQVLPSDFTGGTCKGLSGANEPSGWCYVQNQGACKQALVFTDGALPPGAQTTLQCLEASSNYATTTGGAATTNNAAGDASL